MILRTICLAIILILVSSCRVHKTRNNIAFKKMNKRSEVQLPIKISKISLTELLNSYLPDTLFEGGAKEGLPVSLKVFNGNVQKVDLSGKEVDINLSFDVEMEKKFGFISTSAKGKIEMELYSQLDIDENFHLTTQTTLVEYKWINKPKINIAGFKFSASDWVEKFIDAKQAEWFKQVDSFVAKENILKKYMDSLFLYFDKPIPLDSTNTLGLKITPTNAGMKPFVSDEEIIDGFFNLKFNSEIVPIEDFVKLDSNDVKFSWNYSEKVEQKITLILTMNRPQLQNVIDKYFDSQPIEKKQFDLKGNMIQLDKIDVLFDDELIGVRVKFFGDKEGVIYVMNRPYWDEEQNRLLLLDRDVDFKIYDIGAKVLLSLFGNKVRKKLVDSIEDQLNESINKTINETNNSLSKYKIPNTLKIINFHIPMQVEEKMLFIDINTNISGDINWKGLNLQLISN